MSGPRIAAAPISWGVCEVPDWGYQPPAEQVLSETASVGIAALERGPVGYLPVDPAAARSQADAHRLSLVGGFLPVAWTSAERAAQSRAEIAREAAWTAAAGGEILVLGVTGPRGDFAQRELLTDSQWQATCEGLDEATRLAAAHGVVCAVHQHVGTAVETPADLERVLTGSSVAFCLDTGHMCLAGCDPLEFAERHADRVAHVHLKDVDPARAAKWQRGGFATYLDAVRDGVYVQLGLGNAQIRAVVQTLQDAGYDGWYVLEHDRSLDDAAAAAAVAPAVGRDARFVRAILDRSGVVAHA